MTQQRRLLHIILFFVTNAFVLEAQTEGSYEPIKSSSVRHFTNENGLEQNSTKGLAFDSRGYLWIGTEAGVVCFNGISLKSKFKVPTHQRIYHLDTNLEGNICFIDAANDVFIVESEQMEFEKVEPKYPYQRAGFWELVIPDLQYSGNIDHFYGFFPGFGHLITSNGIHYFKRRDDDNMHFVGAYGLFWFDQEMKLLLNQDDYRRAFVVDSVLVVSMNGILTAYNKDSILYQTSRIYGDLSDMDKHKAIEESFFFSNGQYSYAICGNKLFKLEISSEGLNTTLIMADLPEVKGLRHAVYSHEMQTLALGTFSSGLYIIRNSAFNWKVLPPGVNKKINQPGFIEVNNIGAQVMYNDTSVLTALGVVYTEKSFKKNKFEYYNYFIKSDSSGRFWVTNIANRTLTALDKDFNVLLNLKTESGISAMCEIAKDTFYVSTEFNLFKLEGGKLGPSVLAEDMPASGEISQIFLQPDSTLLILTIRGVYQYNYSTGKLTSIKGAENYYARQMVRTTSGNIWLGTYGQGFYLLRGDTLLGMPLDRKRFLRNSHSFELDENGFLWISTNNGLFQVLETDLINFADKKTQHVYYHYYDKADGLRTNEFNGSGSHSSIKLANGILSFASIDGLLWFHPSKVKPLLPSSPLWVIAKSHSEGTVADLQKSGFLEASSNRVDFEILSSYFGNTYNLFIEYRLLGHDTTWHELPADFRLTYNNLNHGKYSLELRKLVGFGPDNFAHYHFDFYKKKQFYQTAWFYVLCILFLTALIIVIVRQRKAVLISRKNRLEEIVQERTNILEKTIDMLEKSNEYSQLLLSIIVHDIKSPILFMQETFMNLSSFWDQLKDEDKLYYIEEMSQSNFQLTAFVQDFITWMTFRQKIEQDVPLEEFDVKPVLENVAKFIKLPSRKNENEIIVDIETDMKIYSNPGLFEIIVRNLADNASKYMQQGILNISAFTINGKSIVQVKDNGKGMSPELLQKIKGQKESGTPDFQSSFKMGYPIIFEMSSLLKINVDIESSPGAGTIVQLQLPEAPQSQ
jgi:signal transduction histidine kinase